MHPVVFSAAWFERYQSVLLGLLRVPVIGRELRDVLAIRRHDVGYDGRIVALTPHSYTVANPDGTFTTDFRTHAKYAKRLRHQLDGLWRAAHAWDQYVANPFVPALNVGFDTLTQSPDPSPETVSVDGRVVRQGVDESFAALRGGAGNSAASNEATANFARLSCSATSGQFSGLYRAIMLFDTSSLGASAVVSSAVLSLYGTFKNDPASWSPSLDIYSSAPASNTALVNADYGTLGTTSYTGAPISYASWASAYNDFTLNATGLAALALTGVSKFGARESVYDAANSAPTWSSGATMTMEGYFADQLGGTNDPKLVVTYTVPNFLLVTLLGTTP